MRRYFTAIILSTVVTSGALAAGKRNTVPAAAIAGSARSCISLGAIRETRVRDDRTIDFITTGRKIYRNTLPNACPGLGFEQRFAYETSLSQLCSTEIITVLYQAGSPRGASCGLGEFQPVTLTR